MNSSDLITPVDSYIDFSETQHDVFVLAQGGAWLIVDATENPDEDVIVERVVGGGQDTKHSAIAIARDYLQQIEAFMCGERLHQPCVHPLPRPAALTRPARTPKRAARPPAARRRIAA